MELPRQGQRSSSTALLLVISIMVGVGLLSFYSIQTANDQSRQYLEERATTIAAALETDEIAKLSGNSSDENKPAYKSLKSKLTALKQINSDARIVYLTGVRDGQIFFYVDSEQPNSEYYSPPGEMYNVATPVFKNMFFSSPRPLVEGPVTDHFGTWVSGLAPIIDPQTGRVMAVIGIDVDAATYYRNLLGALDLPLGGGIIALVVVIIYEWNRRRETRNLQMRGELVSIASHELRSPLTGIRWAIEGLLRTEEGSPNEAKLHAIHDTILHMQAGTEDILQFTAVTGKSKLTLAQADIAALVKEVCDTQRLGAQQKGVNLVLDDTWPQKLVITCDADRLKRALHNVISNAVKYTQPKTDVIVRYKRTENEHLISIADHGIGIPQAEKKRVFAGFYRASNAKASGEKGTGLGLYLTRTILEQHKGSVTFTSEEGKGTTFVLHLPVRKDDTP